MKSTHHTVRTTRLVVLLSSVAIALAACGGSGGGGSGGNPNPPPAQVTPPKNAALATNGAVASASYDNDHAYYVNDGDTTTTFWAGNIQNDAVTVAFDKTYNLTDIMVYTNATNSSDTRIQLSTDGVSFTDVPYIGGSGQCNSLIISGTGGHITCGFGSVPRPASHVRIVILASTNVGLRQIYELQAHGD